MAVAVFCQVTPALSVVIVTAEEKKVDYEDVRLDTKGIQMLFLCNQGYEETNLLKYLM